MGEETGDACRYIYKLWEKKGCNPFNAFAESSASCSKKREGRLHPPAEITTIHLLP